MRLEQEQEPGEDREREEDDVEAVPGDGHLAELERARHPRRVADLAVGRAEDRAHRLLQDQADAPGGEQRLERPAVEVAHDAALDGDADAAGDEEGERGGDQQRPVEEAGGVGADHLLGDEGGVGAEHDQLAMRHVDDAHHPEGDGEADGGEQQHRAERQAEPDVLRLAPHRLACARSRRPPSVAAAAIAGLLGGLAAASAAAARRCRRARRRPPIAATWPATSASPAEHRRRRAPRVSAAAPRRRSRRRARRRAPAMLLGIGGAERPRPPRPAAWPGRGRISVSVESAARIARRSALLTRTASVERAATGPSSAPVSGSKPWRSAPRPGDAEDRAVGLAPVQLALAERLEHRGGARRRRWRRSRRPPRRAR